MNNREATEKFQYTKQLFAEKRFAEALSILDELNATHPGQKNLMYPRALCLVELGRFEEALPVCTRLISEFSDPRAQALMVRIPAQGPELPSAFDVGDLMPGSTPGFTPGPAPPPSAALQPGPVASSPQAPTPSTAFDPMDLTPGSAPGMPPSTAFDPMDLTPGALPPAQAQGQMPVDIPPPMAVPGIQAAPKSNKTFYIVLACVAVLVVGVLVAMPIVASMKGGGTAQTASDASGDAPKPAETAGGETPAPAEDTAPAATPAADTTPQTVQWYRTYRDGANTAQQHNAPLLLFFYSEDSEDCQRMERDTFGNGTVAARLQGYVCAKVSLEKEQRVLQDYGVETLPEVLVQDANGFPLYNPVGYTPPDVFLAELNEASEGMEQVAELFGGPNASKPSAALFVTFILGALIANISSLYVSLLILNKLPGNGVAKDLLVVSIMALGIGAVSAIPCVGWILGIFILVKVFDMGFIDFVVYAGISAFFGAIFIGLLASMFGLSGLMQLQQSLPAGM